MKKAIKYILIYSLGVIINLTVIGKYYKVNFAYDDGLGFEMLKTYAFLSYAAMPAVMFVCWDSNRDWCNTKLVTY